MVIVWMVLNTKTLQMIRSKLEMEHVVGVKSGRTAISNIVGTGLASNVPVLLVIFAVRELNALNMIQVEYRHHVHATLQRVARHTEVLMVDLYPWVTQWDVVQMMELVVA